MKPYIIVGTESKLKDTNQMENSENSPQVYWQFSNYWSLGFFTFVNNDIPAKEFKNIDFIGTSTSVVKLKKKAPTSHGFLHLHK